MRSFFVLQNSSEVTADLVTFFQQYVPNFQAGDDVVYKQMGNPGSGTGVEALLDIQYIMGIAPGTSRPPAPPLSASYHLPCQTVAAHRMYQDRVLGVAKL